MKSSDPNIRYYDHNKLSAFVTMLVLLMVLTLLVGPAWLFWAIGTMSSQLNTVLLAILSFTLVFSATLAAMTKAKGHEILAASVGYVLSP